MRAAKVCKTLLLLIVLAFALVDSAHASTCAAAATRGTAPSDYQDYCWLDFTGYSDAQAQAGGQPFNFVLPDGSTLNLTVSVTTNKPSPAVVAHAVPSWTGAAFGNSAFLGIPGKPVLYESKSGYPRSADQGSVQQLRAQGSAGLVETY